MFYSAYDPIVEKDQLSYLNLNDAGRVWVWAHGNLETLLGHDQIVSKSIVEYNTMQQNTYQNPVKFISIAMDVNAVPHQVCVYVWRPLAHSPTVRGLVVLGDDLEGQAFAQMHMDNRSSNL